MPITVLACIIQFPNPDNRTGPDEHLLMDADALEEAIEQAEDHSDGEVKWTFAPIMDLNVVTR